MDQGSRDQDRNRPSLIKTGVEPLDAACGGLPAGGITLLVGQRGSGKSDLGLRFILRGAADSEPGVLLTFRASHDRMLARAGEIGYDLGRMIERKLVALECAPPRRAIVVRSGPYALDGLFARLEAAVKEVKAKRLVVDGLEALLDRYYDSALLKQEPERLARWARERGLTTLLVQTDGDEDMLSVFDPGLADLRLVCDHGVAAAEDQNRPRHRAGEESRETA